MLWLFLSRTEGAVRCRCVATGFSVGFAAAHAWVAALGRLPQVLLEDLEEARDDGVAASGAGGARAHPREQPPHPAGRIHLRARSTLPIGAGGDIRTHSCMPAGTVLGPACRRIMAPPVQHHPSRIWQACAPRIKPEGNHL